MHEHDSGDLMVIDLGTGKEVLTVGRTFDAAITDDDKRLAWVSALPSAGQLEIAYVDLATLVSVVKGRAELSATTAAPRIALSDDGRTVAITNGRDAVTMDGKTGAIKPLPARAGGDFGVDALYFDRDGKRLCGVFPREGELCAWDVATRTAIKAAHFVSRRRFIEVNVKGLLPNVSSGAARVLNGALSPDDRTFAVVQREGDKLSLLLFDIEKKKTLARLPIGTVKSDYVSALTVGHEAEHFLVSFDGVTTVIDPKRQAVVTTLEETAGAPILLADELLFPLARGGVVAVHRHTGLKKTHVLRDPREVCAIGPHLLPASGCEELIACP